ncbi:MAG: type II TA system antitoxin MqsA family protein [Chlamydiota bacterium]
MKCLHCGGEKFEEKNYRFTPEVKGEEVEVVVPAMVCTRCHNQLMNDEQMSQLRKASADTYRKTHGLLTSDEIVNYRSLFGMSQAAFANYLKVGEASIKRWETYFVQDVGQDEHIRLKCDEAYAEYSALNVHWKSHPPDIYSGDRRFSWELFKQAVLYLIEFAKSPLFLNKALFYADFKHYQLYGKSITGARYAHLEYGPCPQQYQNLIDFMLLEKTLIQAEGHTLQTVKTADLTFFSASEKEILEFVAKLVRPDGGQKLLDLSHEEDAYKNSKSMALISYKFAKHLKI